MQSIERKKINVAIYCRVSTVEQAEEGYSLESQETRLTKYCESLDYNILKVYKDGGFSGTNLNRPALSLMKEAITNKAFDAIVIYRLDRLSRSQKDTLDLLENTLLPNECDLISITESFDTSTPYGKFMVGILSAFAQLERDNIMDRLMSGKMQKAKNGGWNGGQTPWAYDYIDGTFIPNKNADDVRLAYDMYLQGHGIPTINKKIPHKTRGQIRAWLKAPAYAGMIKYKDVLERGDFEPIVSWEDFCKVQEIMEDRSQPRGPASSKNPLAGICHCKYCGALLTRRYTKAYNGIDIHEYLVCYSRAKTCKSMIKDPSCEGKYHRLENIVELVKEEIETLAFDTDYFKKLQEKQEAKIIKIDYDKKIQLVDEKINRLLDLYLDLKITSDTYAEKTKSLEKEKDKWERLKIEQSERKIKHTNYPAYLKTLQEAWSDLDNVRRNSLLKILIKDIIVENDGLEIVWNFA